jgi:hypothetical protein
VWHFFSQKVAGMLAAPTLTELLLLLSAFAELIGWHLIPFYATSEMWLG